MLSKQEIKERASLLYKLGFNTVLVGKGGNKKRVCGTWKYLQSERQSEEDFQKRVNNHLSEATGVGVITGYNSVFPFDFDKVKDRSIIKEALSLLGLPHDYEHEVISGSGSGHIYVDCDHKEIRKFLSAPKNEDSDVWTFYFKDKAKADHLELRFKQHTVAPGSLHESGKLYEWPNNIPNKPPIKVEASKVANMIAVLCVQENETSSSLQQPKQKQSTTGTINSETLPDYVERLDKSFDYLNFLAQYYPGGHIQEKESGNNIRVGKQGSEAGTIVIDPTTGKWNHFSLKIGGGGCLSLVLFVKNGVDPKHNFPKSKEYINLLKEVCEIAGEPFPEHIFPRKQKSSSNESIKSQDEYPEQDHDKIRHVLQKIIREEKLNGRYDGEIIEELERQGYEVTARVKQMVKRERPSKIKYLRKYIPKNWSIRYNEVKGEYELNKKAMIDEDFNTIYLDCYDEYYDKFSRDISDRDVRNVIESNHTQRYDPIKEYLENLPEFEGESQITKLASCIRTDTGFTGENFTPDFVERFLKKWLVNMIATAIGHTDNPLLLALLGKQGTGKSEFFRRLLPPKLKKDFYSEPQGGLSDDKDFFISMSQNILIMDDELSGKSKVEMKALKKIMSLQDIHLREVYARKSRSYKRRASLCGTGNEMQVLADFTGNRRVIPINVESIDHELYNSIDKQILFAEIYQEYKSGFNYRLTKDDVKALNDCTGEFKYMEMETELVHANLDTYEESGETNENMYSATEIQTLLEEYVTKHKLSTVKVGRALQELGFIKKNCRKEGKAMNRYCISPESKIFQLEEEKLKSDDGWKFYSNKKAM